MSTNLYLSRKRGKAQFNSLTNSNNKLSQVYSNDAAIKSSMGTPKIPALYVPKRAQNSQIKNSLQFLRKKVNGKPILFKFK
jgi:hypothetical protein